MPTLHTWNIPREHIMRLATAIGLQALERRPRHKCADIGRTLCGMAVVAVSQGEYFSPIDCY